MTNSTSCLADPLDRGLAVADGVDDEALGLQSGGQEPRDSGLIFDDEDAHGGYLGAGDAGGKGRSTPSTTVCSHEDA